MSELPWHTGLLPVITGMGTRGCVKVSVMVAEGQPLASVMVMVYTPAERFLAVSLLPPDGDQVYLYAGVPPLALTIIEPVLPPLHPGLLDATNDAKSWVGCVIVTVVLLHPTLSETVTW